MSWLAKMGSAAAPLLAHWRLVAELALIAMIIALKLSLVGEQLHSAKLDRRIAETVAAYREMQAAVKARTAIAQAQDAAHAARIERDQTIVSKETVSAYQSEIAALRRRAAERMRAAAAAADPGGRRGAAVPGPPEPAGGADGAAGEDGLPAQDALTASEIALRLKALQDWVRRQAGVQRE